MFNPFEDYPRAIADRCQDLLTHGKTPREYNNYDLAKIFEYYSAIQLNKDETRSPFVLYEDVLPSFKEKYQLTLLDTGIDLCNSEDAIVQVKLRSGALNYPDLGTFFSSNFLLDEETNQLRVPFQREILCRNTECKLSSTLTSYLRKRRVEDVTFEREEVLDYCQSLLDHPPPKRVRKEVEFSLRDYQLEAIELVCETKDKNTILCLPTGCGKNAVMIFSMKQMMEQDEGARFLVLVPRIILMDQLYEEIVRFMPEMEKRVCLLGDGSNEFNKEAQICVCVYNSFELIPESHHENFTRIFVDEAHHIYCPKIYQEDFDMEDDDEDEIHSEEDDYDEIDSLTEEDEDMNTEIESDDDDDDMDSQAEEDEDMETEIAEGEDTSMSSDEAEMKTTFLDKIRNLATLHKVVCLSATIDRLPGWIYFKKEVREMIDRGFLVDYQFRIPLFSTKVTLDVIAKYLISKFRSIIIFAKNHEEGIEFCKAMNAYMKDCCAYIDCHTSRYNRRGILSAFENGSLPFVVNVRVLCEGFNAPCTQGVYFHHISSSDTTIIQIIGRCLRLHESKSMAQIILPAATDEDATMIHRFIKEVAKNDSRIKECLVKKQLRLYMTTEIGHMDDSTEAEDDIFEKGDLVFNSIGQCLNYEGMFVERLQEVQKYIDEHHEKPPRTTNKLLSGWVRHRVSDRKYERGVMTNPEIKILWDAFVARNIQYFISNEEAWKCKLQQLIKFVEENQRRPSAGSKNGEEKILGSWVANQVTNRKQCSWIMKEESIRTLWDSFTEQNHELFLSNEEVWVSYLQEVVKFIEEKKKRPSAMSKDIDEKRLGNWVCIQVKNRKLCSCIMKDESIRLLWDSFIEQHSDLFLSNEEMWVSNLQELVKFIEEKKKRPSAMSKDIDEKRLGSWVANQVTNRKQCSQIMTNESIRLLWDSFVEQYSDLFLSNEEVWKCNLHQVVKFVEKNNKRPHQKSPNEDEKRLGQWVSCQVTNRKKCSQIMTNESIRLLWDSFVEQYSDLFLSNEEVWKCNLHQVVKFVEKNNKRPSTQSKNSDVKRLGQWVTNQVKSRKECTELMREENIRMLWDSFIEQYSDLFLSNEEVWKCNLQQVVKFVKENKKRPSNISKNADEKRLGTWVANQIQNRKTCVRCMQDPEIRAQWDAFVAKYSL